MSLSVLSWSRLLGILLSVLIISSLSSGNFMNLVFSAGFVHYLLSYYYAGDKIKKHFANPRNFIRLFTLTVAGIISYFLHPSIVVFFGLHFVVNETYTTHRAAASDANGRLLRFSALLLNWFTYCTILHDTQSLRAIAPSTWLALLAASLVFHIIALMRSRSYLSEKRIGSPMDYSFFEVAGLLFAALSFFVHIDFLHLVFYHFVSYTIYPITGLKKQGQFAVNKFIALNVVLTAFFVLVSPVSPLPYHITDAVYLQVFYFWSYMHILTACALSSAHPGWIRRSCMAEAAALLSPTKREAVTARSQTS